MFVAYLWGIETLFEAGIMQERERVCSLPMRDWNLRGGNWNNGANAGL